MVDHFDGDSTVLGFVEGKAGVAVEGRLGESLSQRHQDTEKTSRPERRRPRRHQHLTARQVYGNSETRLKNASIRGTDPSECGADTTALTHRPPDFLKVVIAKRFFPRAHSLWR